MQTDLKEDKPMIVFCILYYICSYVQVVPQIIKLIKTKSSDDYSLVQVFLGYFAIFSWLIYVFCTNQELFVKIGTAVDFGLMTIVNVFIVIYYNR